MVISAEARGVLHGIVAVWNIRCVPNLCGGAVENLDELPAAFEDFIVGGR